MLTYLVNSTIMNNVQYRRRDDLNKTVTSREAILAASQKLVMEKGLQAVNMRTVASVCGVAVGSVYNYFPSKAELLTATVENVWR